MKDQLRSIILFFLTLEAKAVLLRYKPKIIAVTGSVGKTSSKDAVFSALKGSLFVRKSEKSYNTDMGVPLSILGVPNGWSNIGIWVQNLLKGLMLLVVGTPYPKWLVIEVGADRPGDISRSLSWIKPDVVITTKFPEVSVHVEFYESPEAVVQEELFPLSLLKKGGVAVVNADDTPAKEHELPEGVERKTYGFDKGADVRATRYRATSRGGIVTGVSFDVDHSEEHAHVTMLGVLGRGHVYALLAGIAGALAAGVSLENAVKGFETHTPPPGRLRVISGIKKSVLIDDTYNSSPVAVEEALTALKAAPVSGKRVAVLGDMLELGSYSAGEHARMGALAPEHVDILVTVGVRARGMAEKAREIGMPESRVHSFDRNRDANEFLTSFVEEGDTVLIKGSQSIRMERITKALMAEPEKAAELLCRQDTEWLAR